MRQLFNTSSLCSLICLYFFLVIRSSTCMFTEKGENITAARNRLCYINNRIHNALHSLKDSSIEARKRNLYPEVYTVPIVVTGSAAILKRDERFFEDILDSSRNPERNGYNNAVRYLGVENFLLAAVQFCEEESRGGKIDIVSVGSNNGYIEKNIKIVYHELFGSPLRRFNTILIDPDVNCRLEVDYRYVDDLIEERPHIVGHCVVFIFCPEPAAINDGYDIDAIKKLKPKAVLVEYEATGESGSRDLIEFLNFDERYGGGTDKNSRMDPYPIKETLLQAKWMGLDLRLVKVKRAS